MSNPYYNYNNPHGHGLPPGLPHGRYNTKPPPPYSPYAAYGGIHEEHPHHPDYEQRWESTTRKRLQQQQEHQIQQVLQRNRQQHAPAAAAATSTVHSEAEDAETDTAEDDDHYDGQDHENERKMNHQVAAEEPNIHDFVNNNTSDFESALHFKDVGDPRFWGEDDNNRNNETTTTAVADNTKNDVLPVSPIVKKKNSQANNEQNENNKDVEVNDDDVDEETVVKRVFSLLESDSITPLHQENLYEKKMITLKKRIPKPERVGEKDHVISPLWSKCLFMQPSVTDEGLKAYTALCESTTQDQQQKEQLLRGIHKIVSQDYVVVCVTCMSDPNKSLKACLFNSFKLYTANLYTHLERVHKDISTAVSQSRNNIRTVKKARKKKSETAATAGGDNAATALGEGEDAAAGGDDNDGDNRPATKRKAASTDAEKKQPKGPPPKKIRGATAVRVNNVCAFRAAAREMESIIALAGENGVSFPSVMTGILERKNKIVAVLKHHFKGAMRISQIWKTVIQPVATRYDISASNTCFAHSICPENVMMVLTNNNQQQQQCTTTITDRFVQYLGPGQQQQQHVYPLGGLAGIPFAGATGFKMFSRHVPTAMNVETGDCHHAFVLQASHIGLASDATLGTHTRSNNNGGPNDSYLSSSSSSVACCGAAEGAFARCCAASISIPFMEAVNDTDAQEDEFQMAFITREISKRVNVILASKSGDDKDDGNAKQAELARQTYEIGKSALDQIVSADFGGPQSQLFVLTGIQINMPEEFDEDYFQPKSFVIYRKDGRVVDLLAEDD